MIYNYYRQLPIQVRFGEALLLELTYQRRAQAQRWHTGEHEVNRVALRCQIWPPAEAEKEGRVFEIKPGLEFYKPSPAPSVWSPRREVGSPFRILKPRVPRSWKVGFDL